MPKPSRLPYRAAVVAASVATVAALSVSVANDAGTPTRLSDVVTAPVVTPTPVAPQPYRPEPHMTREGKREPLTTSPSASVATQGAPRGTRRTAPSAPADIRISRYRQCGDAFQACIDTGSLTLYAGNILAGHNYMGYQWLASVPTGRTVRVISGPVAGTYRVYGHLRINRQGGRIPDFGSADLVLQTCVGSGTGFSLLHKV
jgi:hypothetical protein